MAWFPTDKGVRTDGLFSDGGLLAGGARWMRCRVDVRVSPVRDAVWIFRLFLQPELPPGRKFQLSITPPLCLFGIF